MAEALGIGSALIAIIGATGRIALKVKEAVEAPQHIMRVLAQVQTFRLTAIMLRNLLIQLMHNNSDQPSSSRCNINKEAQTILYVNDLAGVLFESMSIIAELEKKFEGMGPGTSSSPGSPKATNIAKWMWEEKDILELLQSLESYKSSLDLIVNCLTCQKLDQVQREQAQMFHMMRQQNTHIHGLQLLEHSDATDNMSTSTFGCSGTTLTQSQISYSSSSSTLIMSNPAGNIPTMQAFQQIADTNFAKNMIKNIAPNISGSFDHKEFLKDLLSSRVYNRALRKLAESSEDMTISEFQLSGRSVFRYDPEKQPRPSGSSRGSAQLVFRTPRALFSNSQEMRNKVLIKAVYEGKKEIVRALLSQLDANIEGVCNDLEVGNKGARPLHIACLTKQIEMIKLLLEYGADIEATDGAGNKPLNICTKLLRLDSNNNQQTCSDIARLLLEQGADTEATSKDGNRPLHVACQNGNMGMAKLLLDYGADIEAGDKVGHRPLCIACWTGNMEIAKLLLDHGADIEAANKHGNRLLYVACQHDNIEMTKLLLDYGADIEAGDKDGNQPLHVACQTGRADMTKLLLDHGADIEAANKDGNQPLYIACWTGSMEIVKLLLDHGADIEAASKHGNRLLYIACQHDNIEMTKLLLDHGADINTANKDDNRPLHIACQTGRADMTKLLLDHGADTEAANNDGNRPLHVACQAGSTEMTKLLLDHGADIEAANKNGYRPLHVACWTGNMEMAKLLLDHGVDIEAGDKHGSRPLHVAASEIVARLLLQHGADRTARNKGGELSRWHDLPVD